MGLRSSPSLLPLQSTWHSSTCQFTILPSFSLSSQHVREEQRKAKPRERVSFSKDDGISELNDKVKEALGEQQSGVSFLCPRITLGWKAPMDFIQQRSELTVRK